MDYAFFAGILNNITMLLALCYFFNLITRWWETDSRTGKVLVGVLFGLFAIIGMLFPVRYSTGIIFDGRTILLGILGLFCGPLSAGIAAGLSGLFRLWQGGGGVWTGLATITTATAVGIIGYYWRKNRPDIIRPFSLYGFGLIIHVLMILCMVAMPSDIRWKLVQDISLPILLIYPVATMVFGLLMLQIEDRSKTDQALNLELAERKKIQTALMASEEKFSKVFRHCAEVIGIVRIRDGIYIEVNDAFFEKFGYEKDEVIGHSSLEFHLWHNEAEREELYDILREANTKCLQSFERHFRKRNGELLVVLESVEITEIADENCVIFIWHDITEIKKAELALHHANEELESKVQERTWELVASNQELSALNQEMIALNESMQDTLRNLAKENQERQRMEQEVAATNQELRETVLNLKQTQGQLIQSEKMAALGGLVAGVSHEINTPLGNSITVGSHMYKMLKDFSTLHFSGQAKAEDLEEFLTDGEEALSALDGNLNRAAVLVRSFKDVATNQMVEEKHVFDVKPYLEQIIITLRPRLKASKLQVQVDCPDNLKWNSYPGAFAQILTNIIINSLTHGYDAKGEGTLTITLRAENGDLIIDYADDGNGMEETVERRIFEPFFTTKRGSGGTGLGLYIVYNLVTQKLRGMIACYSEPGAGTKFMIRAPLDVSE